MKKNYFPLLFSILLFAFAGCISRTTEEETSIRTPPNILFIAVDDLRPELDCYGAKHIHSPGIDKLAAAGLVFNRAYCNIPVCGASRASILSGKRPGRYRFLGYNTYLDKDYPGVVSLPAHFKNNGYRTISNGKIYHHMRDDSAAWHEIWRPRPHNPKVSWRDYRTQENIDLDIGHDTRGMPYERADVPDTAYFDGRIAEKAVADLAKLKDGDQPFFLAVGFLKPHLPFNAPEKYWALYDTMDIQLPKNYKQPESSPHTAYHRFGELRNYHSIPEQGPVSDEMAKRLIHGYYATVSYTDAQIDKLLSALETNGLADNTIVILWGDHGWNLGDHMLWCKHCNFASSLRTPLILKVPGKTTGTYTDAITEYIDVYPSLCELAGLPLPEHLDGESFATLIDQPQSRQKDYAISKYFDGVTLVKDQLHYTEWLDENDEVRARMLFDHATDPLELNNLAEKPDMAGKVQELSQFLHSNWGEDFFDQ